MKRFFIGVFALLGFAVAQAQNASVEKDIIGVQIGLFGANAYNEHKLSDAVALRSQLSLHGGFWTGTMYEKTGFLLIPAASLEGKWYYGLNRRVKKGKNTRNNSGNYFSLRAEYFPNWFIISNYNDITNDNNSISIMPTFGIRRSFGRNFNYEFNVGYGYSQTLGKNPNSKGGAFSLSFKIGYDFFKR
ncbi:hypothetical protein ACILFN_10170 [Capnocytophaga canimorsus]|uniref:hypothetical protein n=1 Tax=Capnocytophaga canimorsus TaxID=28188 RepID=UPI0037D7720D